MAAKEGVWGDLVSAEAVTNTDDVVTPLPPGKNIDDIVNEEVPHTTKIKASIVNHDPKLVHFTDFISPEEAAHLLKLAESRWVRSTVTRGSPKDLLKAKDEAGEEEPAAEEPAAEEAAVEEAATAEDEKDNADKQEEDKEGAGNCGCPEEVEEAKKVAEKPAEVVSRGCTSSTVRLGYEESHVVERILARVATVTGYPLENVEQLVLVRYHPGEVFRLHHDGAMRPTTVFTYLNEVASGGETYFPYLGFKVQPHAGTAVMWSNVVPGTDEADRRMDHEALPPGEGCVKYAMNCFVNCEAQRDCSHIVVTTAQGGA